MLTSTPSGELPLRAALAPFPCLPVTSAVPCQHVRTAGLHAPARLPHRQAVAEGGADAACHGPVSQAHFLHSLGIGARLEALLRFAAPADAAALKVGYERYELCAWQSSSFLRQSRQVS